MKFPPYPPLRTSDEAQELYTPPEATQMIIPYLDAFICEQMFGCDRENAYDAFESCMNTMDMQTRSKLTIWEMCYGQGHMAVELSRHGFTVEGHLNMDCFEEEPDHYDIIVTNPPFRNNKLFLKRAIDSGKPFALLIRLEHLGGVKAHHLLRHLDFNVLIPKKRINFITPQMRKGQKSSSPFHSVWLINDIWSAKRKIIYLN